jgi:hypothetical protein
VGSASYRSYGVQMLVDSWQVWGSGRFVASVGIPALDALGCRERGGAHSGSQEPYSRTMPRDLGGWAFSYERGTPVGRPYAPRKIILCTGVPRS